jgi:hypothetical protein
MLQVISFAFHEARKALQNSKSLCFSSHNFLYILYHKSTFMVLSMKMIPLRMTLKQSFKITPIKITNMWIQISLKWNGLSSLHHSMKCIKSSWRVSHVVIELKPKFRRLAFCLHHHEILQNTGV